MNPRGTTLARCGVPLVRKLFLGVLSALLVTTACTNTQKKAVNVSVPEAQVPLVEQLPAGLDLALRIDLQRWREVVSGDANLSLARSLQSEGPLRGLSEPRLAALLAQGHELLLGCHLGSGRCSDWVLALRGPLANFSLESLDVRGGAETQEGARLRYEQRGHVPRESWAQVYFLAPDRYWWSSAATADALTRRLERGGEETSLRPESRGVVSVICRGPALARLLEKRSPMAARWLAGVERAELVAELRADRFELSLALQFHSSSQARRTSAALALLERALAAGDPARFTWTSELLDSTLVIRILGHGSPTLPTEFDASQ